MFENGHEIVASCDHVSEIVSKETSEQTLRIIQALPNSSVMVRGGSASQTAESMSIVFFSVGKVIVTTCDDGRNNLLHFLTNLQPLVDLDVEALGRIG